MRRSFRGAATGAIRRENLEGREHIVVPVVALVEGVIHASNSVAPELVLAEEFGRVPAAWDGRPVMMDHPELHGEKTSANQPAVLQGHRLGYVFNTRIEDRKLKLEAWIDPARVEQVGDEAVQLMERIAAGETAEVSVGVFVETEDKAGEMNGKRYLAVWRDVMPDHLALLPGGTIGACSIEMGCGAPRMAATDKGEGKMTKGLWERLVALKQKFIPAAEEEGTSDTTLRSSLDKALFAAEPAYMGIVDVFPEAKAVVYATAPDGEARFWRRSFALDDAGAVTLGKDVEEGQMATEFRPLAAGVSDNDIRTALQTALTALESGMKWLYVEAVFDTTVVYSTDSGSTLYERDYSFKNGAAAVGSERRNIKRVVTYEAASKRHIATYERVLTAPGAVVETPISAPAPSKEEDMKSKKERVAAIIASGKTCFKAEQASVLEAADEALIKHLEENIETPAPTPAPESAVVPVVPAAVVDPEKKPEPTPAEEQAAFLAKHPDIGEIVSQHKAAASAKKATLVTKLKAAQAVYDEAKLNAMPVTQLEELDRLVLKPSFVGAGAPRLVDANAIPPTPDMGERIKAASRKSA